jgi:cobalt/nickel transport system permease protein
MHANAFDRYQHGHSLLHNLDARIKVLVTIAYILSNVLLPDGAWIAFALSLMFLAYCNWLSGLGLGFTFKRSFVALPFALVAGTAIFSIPGQPLGEWHFGMLTLIPTDAGVLRFVSVLVRSWLSVQVAILLVAVTEFPDIIHALSHLYVPAIIVTIIAFLYRYLFVLTDEVMRLMRARQARSAGTPDAKAGGRVLWRARVAGNMAGQLFLRSYERSDRIYNAMLSRGYQGQLQTMHAPKIQTVDWLVASVAFASLIVMQVLGRLS